MDRGSKKWGRMLEHLCCWLSPLLLVPDKRDKKETDQKGIKEIAKSCMMTETKWSERCFVYGFHSDQTMEIIFG